MQTYISIYDLHLFIFEILEIEKILSQWIWINRKIRVKSERGIYRTQKGVMIWHLKEANPCVVSMDKKTHFGDEIAKNSNDDFGTVFMLHSEWSLLIGFPPGELGYQRFCPKDYVSKIYGAKSLQIQCRIRHFRNFWDFGKVLFLKI